jgi:hypothetical protein
MSNRLRALTLAAGAAALMSTQAVYAAPVSTGPAVDPMVAVSLFGTAQSRAAVCGSGASCMLPAMATPATADASSLAAASAALAYQEQPRKRVNTWLIVGGVVVLAVILLLLLGDDDGDGDLSPVSPN